MKINIGDDITINGTIVQTSDAMNEVLILTSSKHYHWVHIEDINTIHPYQPIPETDERRGQ